MWFGEILMDTANSYVDLKYGETVKSLRYSIVTDAKDSESRVAWDVIDRVLEVEA
jgi:hypothetical protein